MKRIRRKNDWFDIKWMIEPEAHDYDAARQYLSLLYPPKTVQLTVLDLTNAVEDHWDAKDILRASGLELLHPQNSHVVKDLNKIRKGQALSPVLLVVAKGHLVIADGYHRVCAAYHYSEDAVVTAHLVELRK